MWQARLDDVVASMKNGMYKPASEYADDGTPCLRMYNIDAGSIVWRDIKRMRVSEQEFAEYGLHEGDLLVNRVNSRELVGKAACIPASLEPSVFESKNIRVRLDTAKALPKFINYQLFARGSRHFASNAQQVVGMASISQKQLADFPIVLTDIEEQRRIVAEIEKQFSRLDEAVANLQRVKANLKRYKASVLKAAVEGTIFPDLVPHGWRRARLGDVAEVISGLTKSPKRISFPMKLPYLRVANVYANELRLDDVEHIGVADKELEKLLVRRGDLLMVEGNGSPDQIGRVALWDGSIPNCVHQNHLIKVRLGAEVLPEWALAWLLSPGGRHEIEQVSASTSGLHTLSTGKVTRLPIPVPSLGEQQRIVAEVDRRLSTVREVETEVDVNLKRAQVLKQSVLRRAFSDEVTSLRANESNAAHLEQSSASDSHPTEPAPVVMAAKIMAANCDEFTFGRVKLQKMMYLAAHLGRIEAANGEYVRMQAGPLDMQMLEGVTNRLNDLRWFRQVARPGKSPRDKAYAYERLTKADDYRQHLGVLTPEQNRVIDGLNRLMRTWSSEECELFATVYAAWNDLILRRRNPTADAIIFEVREMWHESKKKFSPERISEMIDTIMRLDYAPTGWGLPTDGEMGDDLSGDLFGSDSK